MNQQQKEEFLLRLQKNNPHPKTELVYNTPFELLIAVILSAQATDISVNRVTQKLFVIANTPKEFILLGVHNLESYIKTIGLFRTKASNIIATCKILIAKYAGLVPENRTALESLHGVGRKTANVVLNTAFGWPTIAVDTHVFRVSNRSGLATGRNVTHVEKELLTVVPAKLQASSHHLLIHHGRYICTARNPQCNTCVVADICDFTLKAKR